MNFGNKLYKPLNGKINMMVWQLIQGVLCLCEDKGRGVPIHACNAKVFYDIAQSRLNHGIRISSRSMEILHSRRMLVIQSQFSFF